MAVRRAQAVVARVHFQRVVVGTHIDKVVDGGRLHGKTVACLQFVVKAHAAAFVRVYPLLAHPQRRAEQRVVLGDGRVYECGAVVVEAVAVDAERQVEVEGPGVALVLILVDVQGYHVVVVSPGGVLAVLGVEGRLLPVGGGGQKAQLRPVACQIIEAVEAIVAAGVVGGVFVGRADEPVVPQATIVVGGLGRDGMGAVVLLAVFVPLVCGRAALGIVVALVGEVVVPGVDVVAARFEQDLVVGVRHLDGSLGGEARGEVVAVSLGLVGMAVDDAGELGGGSGSGEERV